MNKSRPMAWGKAGAKRFYCMGSVNLTRTHGC
jgi:hypothetical protein